MTFSIAFFSLESFPHQLLLMVFQRSLSDSKSPQVSSNLRILLDLDNAVVWMAPTRSLIFISSSPFTKLLMTISNAPITIDNTVAFMFYSFFSPLAMSRKLSPFFPFFFLLSGKRPNPPLLLRLKGVLQNIFQQYFTKNNQLYLLCCHNVKLRNVRKIIP